MDVKNIFSKHRKNTVGFAPLAPPPPPHLGLRPWTSRTPSMARRAHRFGCTPIKIAGYGPGCPSGPSCLAAAYMSLQSASVLPIQSLCFVLLNVSNFNYFSSVLSMPAILAVPNKLPRSLHFTMCTILWYKYNVEQICSCWVFCTVYFQNTMLAIILYSIPLLQRYVKLHIHQNPSKSSHDINSLDARGIFFLMGMDY